MKNHKKVFSLWTFALTCGTVVYCKGGGKMHTTIVDTILDPNCEKHYSISNIDEKIELCIEIKELEDHIKIQLDQKHQKMFDRYTELWDELHTGLAVDTFASGIKFATE